MIFVNAETTVVTNKKKGRGARLGNFYELVLLPLVVYIDELIVYKYIAIIYSTMYEN